MTTSIPPDTRMAISTALHPDRVEVRITGDIDLADEPHLDTALRTLAGYGCRTVRVDASGVGFAGTTLVNFLARVYAVSPAGTTLTVHRAGPAIRRLLELTSFAEVLRPA